MGVRRDKGLALARYLTGTTGIPFLSWDGNDSRVDAPAPYSFDVTTSRKLQHWTDNIVMDAPDLHFSIRYDNALPSVDKAWIATTLDRFVPLLQAHYDTITDRIKEN